MGCIPESSMPEVQLYAFDAPMLTKQEDLGAGPNGHQHELSAQPDERLAKLR
jgi:hypothetical protein